MKCPNCGDGLVFVDEYEYSKDGLGVDSVLYSHYSLHVCYPCDIEVMKNIRSEEAKEEAFYA